MSLNLKIFLIITCLLFMLYIYKNVKNKKMEFKSAISFFAIIVALMFVSVFDEIMIPIRNLLGFETTSNMIFFIGYICVLIVLISMGIKISLQEEKITKLIQEIAILKKEIKNEKDNK